MWSSSDLQGGYPTQWALNPSAYQNVSNEEVDWASLAQQWIKMKETFPAEQVPPAPPPPPLGGGIGGVGTAGLNLPGAGLTVKSSTTPVEVPPDLEGGEAPMDMDTKEDNDSAPTGAPGSDSAAWGSWNNWQQWGWGNSWSGTAPSTTASTGQTPGATSVGTEAKSGNTATSSFPFPANTTSAQSFNAEGSSNYDYNHSGSVEQFNQHGFWMGGSTPYIRQKNSTTSNWRHDSRHVSGRVGRGPQEKSDEDEEAVPVIDAAKRKQLPAWIREGLEKMEKEKLKKEERDRMIKEREIELARQKEIEELNQQNNQDIVNVPHSKFDSDSDESDDEDQEKNNRELESQSLINRKSRFDQTSNRNSVSSSPPQMSHVSHHVIQHATPPAPVYKSKEQIMQETMKKVRVVLTDILMCVTSEELEKAANEVLTSMRAKAPAKQHRKTPALTSLTGKLGLGIYNSDSERSDASDEDEDDNDFNNDKDNGIDSDEELKERYQRRKQEFARIENDILISIEEQEERERRQLLEDDVDERDEEDDDNNDFDDNDDSNDRPHANDAGGDETNARLGADHQVEAKYPSGNKGGERRIESADDNFSSGLRYDDQSHNENERRSKKDQDSSRERSEESDDDDDNSDSSESSSQSVSSGSRSSRKRRKYSSKKRKEKKNSRSRGSSSRRKRSRSRSRSRDSDKKRSSHRKSSHDSYRKDDRRRKESDRREKDRDRGRDRRSYREEERSRTRDRSRSRDRDRDRRHGDSSYRYRRHSPSPQRRKHYSSSSSHRRRRSSSSSDSARGSKRSGRDHRRSRSRD